MTGLKEFSENLSGQYDIDECRAIFQILKDENLSVDVDVLHRLQSGEPIQYIVGTAWFYGNKFKVNKHTLIPRPETEELCDLIIKEIKGRQLKAADIGTGSGCIAITLAANVAGISMTATDFSESALKLAQENAGLNKVENSTRFILHNFLEDDFLSSDLNLIVSNPPYIHRNEFHTMPNNVKHFEPYSALFPEGDDVLIFYKQLKSFLMHQIDPDCILWAEINQALGNELTQIFQNSCDISIFKDISGNDRFLRAKKKGPTGPPFE